MSAQSLYKKKELNVLTFSDQGAEQPLTKLKWYWWPKDLPLVFLPNRPSKIAKKIFF